MMEQRRGSIGRIDGNNLERMKRSAGREPVTVDGGGTLTIGHLSEEAYQNENGLEDHEIAGEEESDEDVV